VNPERQRRYDPMTGGRLANAPWMLMPPGHRYPYPAGRCCCYCAEPLSRYNPGPACHPHQERYIAEQEAVA
jgi:hypothetical protein